MNLIRPSSTAKSFPIGERFTGKHRLVHDLATGELSECLPPVTGSAETIQRLLLTSLPERRVSLLDKLGVYLPAAVSKNRLNPATGVMR